jgi:hypothetical protein
MRSPDLTNRRFFRLLVVSRAPVKADGNIRWHCQCDCGKAIITTASQLIRGQTQSCGCLRRDIAIENGKRNRRYEPSQLRARRAYQSAKNRCENPKYANYKHYGGRGILFLWPSFGAFFAEMGNPPPGTTLDRIETNGHYESGNCRWATHIVQHNNRRNNRILTAFGRTQTMGQWARELKMHTNTIIGRLTRGMSNEQALSIPVRPYKDRLLKSDISE